MVQEISFERQFLRNTVAGDKYCCINMWRGISNIFFQWAYIWYACVFDNV